MVSGSEGLIFRQQILIKSNASLSNMVASDHMVATKHLKWGQCHLLKQQDFGYGVKYRILLEFMSVDPVYFQNVATRESYVTYVALTRFPLDGTGLIIIMFIGSTKHCVNAISFHHPRYRRSSMVWS